MIKIEGKQIAIFTILITFFFKLYLIVFQIGNKDWEPDSYQHFLELKTVYSNFPHNLDIGIHVWSKPLYSYILGIPVKLFDLDNFLGIQIINLLIFSFIAFLVYKIAKQIYKNESVGLFALIATLFSFLLFKSSITALTEPIFTLTLVLGFYFIIKEKFSLASIFFGLSVLGRIEGLFFVGIYNLWLIYKFGILSYLKHSSQPEAGPPLAGVLKVLTNKFVKYLIVCWILTLLPVLIWNFIGFLDTGRLFFIFDNGYPTVAGQYGYGSWLDFPKRLLLQEPLIMVLFVASFFIFIKRFRKLEYMKELLMAFILFSGFTFTQMYFWVIGQFGSAGLMRYLISVMPFAIIFSCLCIDFALQRIKNKNFHSFAILSFITILILTLAAHFLALGPLSSKWITFEPEFKEAGEYIKENYNEDIYLYTDRPEVIYYSDRDLQMSTIFYKFQYDNGAPGVYVWTESWGESITGITREDVLQNREVIENIEDKVLIFEIE